MKIRLLGKPAGVKLEISSAVACALLCFGTAAYAQNTNNANNANANGNSAELPDLVEITPFGGIALYGTVNAGLGVKMVDGGVIGTSVTFNVTRWVGIQGWVDWARGNVEFRTPSGLYPPGTPLAGTVLPNYSFLNHDWNWGLDPIIYLRPRGSRVQPYLQVGVGGIQFTPDKTAKTSARNPATDALFHSANLNDNLQVALNYGGGIKFHFSDHVGLQLDARGFWSRNPTFDLPNYPDGGIYIPAKQKLNSFQGTVGLVFYLGEKKCPPMPPAPPPPAPPTAGTITGAEGATICQGKPVTLHSTAAPGTAGHTLSYAWKLNGQPSGSNSPDFTFTPNNTGDFTVEVTVTDTTPPPPAMTRPKDIPQRCWIQPPAPQAPAPVTATTTVTVQETAPTITSVTADPNTLSCAANTSGTHTATLTGAATPSACGGNLTYKWTVTEGSVTNDTSPTATFDASTVNFEGGAQGQTKTVTATLTVTDETGKTASKTADITINCQPQFVRLSDVIFAKNNARVNNCGKRVLIDEAAPRAASGDYDIVLVGHRDNDERAEVTERGRRRGRHAAAQRALDEQRTLNCAAVLSGGTGTCGHVDPAHIRVDWVGTDQTSEPQPGLCGTSNLPSQKERRGSQTSAADKNRRVEVYLVPRNSTTMPPAVKNIKPLPEREVKALGCPK
jgi:outer membrane protein OmpA-like peptidoglycan-associated protein/opacity protein-like surface antigen